MRYAALLDTETTGLSPQDGARCIEVAVMLYDVKYAAPVASFASLIRGEQDNAAYAVNGIAPDLLPEARPADEVWKAVKWLIAPAGVLVAYRAEFDRQFCPDLGKPWCCSKFDIRWPGGKRGDHLVQLALSLGLGVASAHRAMTDVDTLARIFTRIADRGHDLNALLMQALRPKLRYVALVSFDDRQKAKDHGFAWNPTAKVWWRDMPPEDVSELPFAVRAGTYEATP